MRAWERHEEARAGRSALEGDFAVVALDDGLRYREPHSGPFAGFLGGEERIEDAAAIHFGNSGSGVLEHHDDAAGAIVIRDASPDRQSPAGNAHGIERV